MKQYVGIDLGTTNSAICTYDGCQTRIWKSPEQNDVTPSAIFVDKRGNRYYGNKAYNQAPYSPNNSATLFKRFMGTNTKINFESSNESLSPEECSAELLKVLFGYLPEEIRNAPDTATVITVPAAFNQMKKDATLQAAKLAGIGNVALMQEPVAAIMSIMKTSSQEGIFLVYDLGGGTFDVSVAENIGGKVNLLAHGGIEMCGGRDIDRTIFNRVVVPWLKQTFSLPDDFLVNRKYNTFCRLAQWATEQAKIELSSAEQSVIALSEMEARTVDEAGSEVYIDVEISRELIDGIIADLISETVNTTRTVLQKTGLTAIDVEKIVFIGGPTNYKPLRDKVAFELSIAAAFDVNPMTAVAEGASIFAESIDWSGKNHTRKKANQIVTTSIDLSFKYTARTSGNNAKVLCVTGDNVAGYSIAFSSKDTGWSSGRAPLTDNLMLTLPLSKNGNNVFSVKVYNESGNEIKIGTDEIIISKTLATIGAIPASYSIGVEVVEKLGGTPVLQFIINEGDSLPQRGSITFKAGQTLKAGTNDSINIKLWEGNIQSPITDNRFIGVFKITGTDFDSGVIPTGSNIECEFEMTDSGTINIQAAVPCIGAVFSDRNFYSRQEGQLNLDDVDSIAEQGRDVIERIDSMEEKVSDERLATARKKAELAAEIDSQENGDLESIQKASNELLEAKKLINKIRQANLKQIRQMELDSCTQFYHELVEKYATTEENSEFNSMVKLAQQSIDRNDQDFDNILERIKVKNTVIMLHQDWFVADWYRQAVSSSANYLDKEQYTKLKLLGDSALKTDDMQQLREALFGLLAIQIRPDSGVGMFDVANIVKG